MIPVDSVHSTFELLVRNGTIWPPSEWSTIIRSARTNPSGNCYVEMNHKGFQIWKKFTEL